MRAFGSAARPRFLGLSFGGSRDPASAASSQPRAVGGSPMTAERGRVTPRVSVVG